MVRKGAAYLIFFMVFVTLPFSGTGQVMDDFSDGDFTANPLWSGDSLQFEVNTTKQLHLKSSGTDSAFLSTPSTLIDSTEWSFYVKCSFSPSGSNFARVYLTSDQPALAGPLNAYYLQLGESGSADAIELFRQEGNTKYSICRGPDGMLATSFAIGIKVVREAGGLFKVYADTLGGNNYSLFASGTDTVISESQYFGFYCRYTSSNATKFYFDDVMVRNIYLDQQAPDIASVKALGKDSLSIRFSEPVDFSTAILPVNYSVNFGVNNPVNIVPDLLAGNVVKLIFDPGFPEDEILSLTVRHISDLSGNQLDSARVDFSYHRLKQNDIVINEIMADPEPQVGLPPVEYIEFYNRTDFPIDLTAWVLHIGTSKKSFPPYQVPPHSFLLAGSEEAQIFFANFGPSVGFSSFSLANDGADIVLADNHGRLISAVSYSSDWYKNPVKDDGGYSLEQVDPANPCGGEMNWVASCDVRGGTPGKANSVLDENPDEIPPSIAKIAVRDSMTLRLTFTEAIDSLHLLNPEIYSIDGNIGHPSAVVSPGMQYSAVDLHLADYLEKNTMYRLRITDTLFDCSGNQLVSEEDYPFAIPEIAQPGDLVINEILFDPGAEGAEFLELYNNSNKIIDLNDLVLCSRDTLAGTLTDIAVISDGRLMFPGDYLVISADPEKVKQAYNTQNPRGFEKMPQMPALSNEGDVVVLADRNLQVMDEVTYSGEWHHPLLNATAGVSLERISFLAASNDPKNWHSAAKSVGYATPAYRNSQVVLYDSSGLEVDIQPRFFTPDNDGYNDNLHIQYSLNDPGYQANILIFNDHGQRVRVLVNNDLCGSSGSYFWDGCDDLRQLCNTGYYIIYIRMINTAGMVKTFKKAVALGVL